jgi:DnaK suppressor protein
MIVSILQLMGFPLGKPVHSRAGETPPGKASKAPDGNAAPTDHAQAKPARRKEVKAISGKDTKAKTDSSKVPAAVKPTTKPVAKPAKASATPVKIPVKPAGKTAAKVPAKAVSKTPVQTVAVKSAKPVTKAIAKPVTQPAVKSAVKPAVEAAAKAVAKPVAKSHIPVSPVAKPVVKSPAKSASTAAAAKEIKSMSVTPTVVKVSAAPAPAAVPAKAGRPSSRLAQLTVPSMAQTVASTAAKASYGEAAASSPLIVPVLPSSVKKDPKLANNWKTKPLDQLTDADLMAMPDSEYMNEVQMAAFRLKLSILKRDILSNAGETTEHLREDSSVTPDPADRATIEEEHALELRTRDRERKLLKKIEQSIVRIDAGDYGYCDETGEAIGVGRLLARPTATLSLEAQQRRELKQKMFGD